MARLRSAALALMAFGSGLLVTALFLRRGAISRPVEDEDFEDWVQYDAYLHGLAAYRPQ